MRDAKPIRVVRPGDTTIIRILLSSVRARYTTLSGVAGNSRHCFEFPSMLHMFARLPLCNSLMSGSLFCNVVVN
jgi:hypothetical protein